MMMKKCIAKFLLIIFGSGLLTGNSLGATADTADTANTTNTTNTTNTAEGSKEDATLKSTQQLAEQGDAEAQSLLGYMYANGRGVPQDDSQAVKWLQKAAEQGLAKAQYNLGVAYSRGQGVPKNKVVAYALFNLAAAKGVNLATTTQSELVKELSSQEISEGKTLSSQIFDTGSLLPIALYLHRK